MWVKTWEKTGLNIASIAFTELYLALQTGTVDAEENPPNFIRAQKFNEVQDYVMTTDHVRRCRSSSSTTSVYEALRTRCRPPSARPLTRPSPGPASAPPRCRPPTSNG